MHQYSLNPQLRRPTTDDNSACRSTQNPLLLLRRASDDTSCRTTQNPVVRRPSKPRPGTQKNTFFKYDMHLIT